MSDIEEMSTIPAKVVPAGWYPDATHGGVNRWWDGAQWTDAYQGGTTTGVAQQVVVNAPARKGVNHAFHLIMSLVTLGLWVPVWIIVAIAAAVSKD